MDIDTDSIPSPDSILGITPIQLEELETLSLRSLGVDPDSPTPGWLTRKGVDPEFLHLQMITLEPFLAEKFESEFRPIEERYKGKGLFGSDYFLTVIGANDSVVNLVNRFLFLVSCKGPHQKTKCAMIMEDKELGWMIDYRTELPLSDFASFTMPQIVFNNPRKKRMIDGREVKVQIHTMEISPTDKNIIEIWRGYSHIRPTRIARIEFDPQLKSGFSPYPGCTDTFIFNEWRGLPHPRFGPDLNTGRNRMEIIGLDDYPMVDGQLFFFLYHVFFVICDGDSVAANYLLDWIAYRRMFPWKPMEVMICITGEEQGTGKSMLMNIMNSLFGLDLSIYLQDPSAFDSQFNGFLYNKILLLIDEVKLGQHRADYIKTFLTSKFLNVNEKFKSMMTQINRMGLFVSSNHNTEAIPPGVLARRVFWVSVNPRARQLPSSYWDRLIQFTQSEELLFQLDYYFHQRALRPEFQSFEPRKRPLTDALRRSILYSLQGPVKWLYAIALHQDLLKDISPHHSLNLLGNDPQWRNEIRWPPPDHPMNLKALFQIYQSWHLNIEKKPVNNLDYSLFCQKLHSTFGVLYSVQQTQITLPDPIEIQRNLVDFNKDYAIPG